MINYFKNFLNISLFLFFLFNAIPLNAEQEIVSLDFFTLENEGKNDQFIQIRGFLYKMAGSQLILAAEPNLKSCCVGNNANRNKQLLVFGGSEVYSAVNQGNALTLRGKLLIDSRSDYKYRLEEASLVEDKSQYSLMVLVVGGFVLIFAYLVKTSFHKQE